MGDIPEGVEAVDRAGHPGLTRAAQACGIEVDYWDLWGKQHLASPRTQTAILESLGVDVRTPASLEQALEERVWREWERPLPPTLVLTEDDRPYQAPVSLPAEQAHLDARITLRTEQGNLVEIQCALGDLGVAQEVSLRGRSFVRKKIRLPDNLPLGYHRLSIEIGGQPSDPAWLIVCPARAYEPPWLQSGRAAGIAISLYGVRSHRNWGCGDTTDLKAFIAWTARQTGATFVALNPLHAIPNRQPYNTSPYLPNSIFYRNPIYLDLERIEEFKNCPEASALLASSAVQAEIQELRAADFVEYEHVFHLKLRFLKFLFRVFLKQWTQDAPRARELRDYIHREGDLLDRFAVHSALDEAIHKQCPDVWNWRSWPEQFQDPQSAATQQFAQQHWRSVLFYKYIQWQLDLQFAEAQQEARRRGLSIGLYHDLALATDRFGADLWAHRSFFVSGSRVGSPPDGFSPKGQDWAFPPPNAERHYQDGYRLFAESIRKNLRHGGALRIDHVMRFFRLFWIPDGMQALEGTYVRDRHADWLRILALESVRNKVLIVGEDLGTVPDEVREALHRVGILSYRLLYFEQDPSGRMRKPEEYPRDALASATTHDLPTLAGFWLGRDIEARRSAGLLPDDAMYRQMLADRAREKQKMLDVFIELKLLPDWFPRNAADVPELRGELHNAVVGFLASTPCKLMVLNQEDLLKETEQQNLPGSTAEYPNWRRKMRCPVEELWESPEVQAFTRMFRAWMERTGRLNSAGGNATT
jgi:4-alpha-glucanotransferase